MKRRAHIREGGRWKHRTSGRTAIIARIHYPGFVEYKYEVPASDSHTRRTRVGYGSFVMSFDHVKKERR